MPRKKQRVKPGTNKASAAQRKRAFARQYVTNGRNATRAAIAVGYTERSAHTTGHRLLKDAEVNRLVEQMAQKAEEIADLSAEELLRRNANIIRFDLRNLYKPDGTVKEPSELDDATAMALSHMGREGYVPNDRQRALDMAFRNMGLYKEDNQQLGRESLHLKVEVAQPKRR